MAEKKPSVKRHGVTKSPEVLAAETFMAVISSDTGQEAANKLGITRQQVYWRIKEYGLTEKIKAIKEDALAELHFGATKAARNLVQKIDSENEAISKSASDSVLDRIGLTKSDSTNTNIFLGEVKFINEVPRPKRDAQD